MRWITVKQMLGFVLLVFLGLLLLGAVLASMAQDGRAERCEQSASDQPC